MVKVKSKNSVIKLLSTAASGYSRYISIKKGAPLVTQETPEGTQETLYNQISSCENYRFSCDFRRLCISPKVSILESQEIKRRQTRALLHQLLFTMAKDIQII
ncbi:hypothetical protein BON23_4874 [Saccharomyces cerevisiae]|nr:hypothetical protein BON23_4874 [Saccharomyces cerevisiae]